MEGGPEEGRMSPGRHLRTSLRCSGEHANVRRASSGTSVSCRHGQSTSFFLQQGNKVAKKNAEMFPYSPSSPPAFQIQKLYPGRQNLEIKLNSSLTGFRIKYKARSSMTKRKEAKIYVIKAKKSQSRSF